MTGKTETCTCIKGALAVAALLGILATPALATDMPLNGSGSSSTCSDTLYDSGGSAGDYTNGELSVYTYSPDTVGQVIRATFVSWDVENNWDFLNVYDGPTTGSPLIASLTGNPPFIPDPIISSAAGGELTFELDADGSVSRAGFEATIDCIVPPTTGACCLDNETCENMTEASCLADANFFEFGGLGTDCGSYNCNDECAGAIEIVGLTVSGDTAGSSTSAQQNSGCFGMSMDLWYWYEVTTTGTLAVETCGSGFDTEVAVWDGCGGAELACDDDDTGGCTPQSRVCLESVTVGQIIYIQVGYWSSSGTTTGPFTITITPNGCSGACCGFYGVCAGPMLEADCTAAGGTYQGDTSDCSDRAINCTGACCLPNGDCQAISEASCSLAGFDYQGNGTSCMPNLCPQPPINDTCATAFELTCGSGTISATTSLATNDYDPGVGNSCTNWKAEGPDIVYFMNLALTQQVTISMNPTPSFDASLYVTTDCGVLDPCVAGDDSGNPETVVFNAAAGTTYYIICDGFSTSSFGDFDLTVSCDATPRGNCCNATVLFGTVCYDDDTEAECMARLGVSTWVDGGTCAVEGCPIGRCCENTGVSYICSDVSEAECNAKAGATTWDPALSCATDPCPRFPTNDTCSTYTLVTDGMLPFNDLVDTTTATSGLPYNDISGCNSTSPPAGTKTLNDVWWCYSPTATCLLTIQADPTDYDGVIAIYTGPDCDNLALDQCDDDPEPYDITFEATPGTKYWIHIGGYRFASPSGGLLSLSITCAPPVAGACCFGADGSCLDTDNIDCLNQGGTFFAGGTCATTICTGACCLTNGSCQNIGETSCAQSPGSVWGPLGSECATTNCPQPEPNDLCANAIIITQDLTPFSTVDAFTDGPEHSAEGCQFDGQTYNDVWFEYTATCSADLTISFCNEEGADADYDTDVVIYDGCDCENLIFLGCNDDAATTCTAMGSFRSRLTVPVTAGNCYLIRVGGFGSSNKGTGTFSLSCPNICGTCTGDVNDDTKIDGEDIQAFTDCVLDAGNGPGLAPTVGCACADIDGDGDVDNDDVDDFVALLLSPTAGPCVVGRCCYDDGGAACSEVLTEIQCLQLTGGNFAPGLDCTTVCPVGRCCSGPPQTPVCSDITQAECTTLSGSWDGGLDCTTACPIGPVNDECDAAIAITQASTAWDNTNATDSGPDEASCLFPFGDGEVYKDLWYTYVADCDGTLFVDTCGSGVSDTRLIVYGGTCAALGTPLECNDDHGNATEGDTGLPCAGSLHASLSIQVTVGQSVIIRVGNFSDATTPGAGLLNVACVPTPTGACCEGVICNDMTELACLALSGGVYVGDGEPCSPDPCGVGACCDGGTCSVITEVACLGAGGTFQGAATICAGVVCNDDCVDATPVTDGTPAAEGDNSTATSDGLTLSCEFGVGTSHDVWFEYTATCTGTVTMDTEGSGQSDTNLAVYDACGGNEIACDEDSGTGFLSSLSFTSTASTKYWVRLGTYDAAAPGGDYDLNISCCSVACMPMDTLEAEPICSTGFLDTFNGGCFSTPPVFQTITCDETVCGTSGTYLSSHTDLNTRDTDWYAIVVTNDTEITWTVEAGFPVEIGFIENDGIPTCPGSLFLVPSATGAPCDLVSVSKCVPPGTYWLFVSVDGFTGVDCGSVYRATATCAPCVFPRGACCTAARASCAITWESDCNAAGGIYVGDGTDCTGTPCNDLCECEVVLSIFPATEDWESDTFVGSPWVNETDDEFDWSLDEGGTPSTGTGPSVDHTLGTALGIYAFIETSSGSVGDEAHLQACADLTGLTDPALTFWYHMLGTTIGTLAVDVSDNGCISWTREFSVTGAQGDVWLPGAVSLAGYSGVVSIRIVGIHAGTFTGDIAIDDLRIGGAPTGSGACCLPNGTCETQTEISCLTSGNSYQGDDVPCTPNPCPQPTYCTTSWSDCGVGASDDWITNVTLNTINNNTVEEGCAPDSYGDYTAMSTSLSKAVGSYAVSVSVDSGTFTQHVFVWVDWNQDLVFDGSEATDLGSGSGSPFTLNGNIIVPGGALLGSTRMRVSERFTTDPGPCDNETWGETEDYTINVVN